jgi:hypothetical protein
VHLALDIFQGLGIAAAVGIRPFLPALLVGALAAGDVQIDFQRTDYSFLQAWEFLLGMFLAAVILALLERRLSARPSGDEPRALVGVLGAAGLALGALLFAGALAQDHHTSWPGLIAGVICAALGVLAIRPLLARVRARLRGADASALPAYVEVIALVLALLAVLLPPVGILIVVMLLWLLLAGRRRQAQKYAGLRILR